MLFLLVVIMCLTRVKVTILRVNTLTLKVHTDVVQVCKSVNYRKSEPRKCLKVT
jgi:hypothetical protein